jgi:hypothetical protein
MNPIPKKTPEIEPPQQPGISPSIPEIKPDPERHEPMPVVPEFPNQEPEPDIAPYKEI